MKQHALVPCYRCQQMTKPSGHSFRPVEISRNSKGDREFYLVVMCKRCRTWVDRNKLELKLLK